MQSGLEVIEAVRGRLHPLADMIVDAVAGHIKVYGDGSKTIVKMLQIFLTSLSNFQPKRGQSEAETRFRCDLIRQIDGLKTQMVSKLLRFGTYYR